MRIAILAFAVAAAGFASGSAHAIRECEPLEIDCHKTCTLPQGGIKDLHWAQC